MHLRISASARLTVKCSHVWYISSHRVRMVFAASQGVSAGIRSQILAVLIVKGVHTMIL